MPLWHIFTKPRRIPYRPAMNTRVLLVIVGLVAALVVFRSGRTSGSHELPKVFTVATYADARTQLTDGRLLIVDGTASWCPPCQAMKSSTWTDPAVEAWFATNGTVIALDVDEYGTDAAQLGIESIPTLIAFRNNAGTIAEIGRTTGFKDPTELINWLNDLPGPASK